MGIYLPSYDMPTSYYFWQLTYLVVISQAACRLATGVSIHMRQSIASGPGFYLIAVPAVIGIFSCHPLGLLPLALMFTLAQSTLDAFGSIFALVLTLFSFWGMVRGLIGNRMNEVLQR